MTPQQKETMFQQVRLDIHMADAYASEVGRSTVNTAEQASELLRRCVKANASCQAWERAMRGVEPPKMG